MLIDAGGPMGPLFDALDRDDLTLTAVLLTHHHYDHVCALDEVLERHPGTPVLIHALERELVPPATGEIVPGEPILCGGVRIEPLHTPGHTAGMVSLLVSHGAEQALFTGDTLFKGSVGGVRAPGHTTYEDLKSSIMDKLLALPPSMPVHPGHTDPTTVGDELEQQRVRAHLARARRRGLRAVHRARRAGDAGPARRRLRRRPQGVGALARRLGRHRAGLEGRARLGAALAGVGRRARPRICRDGARQNPHLPRRPHREDRADSPPGRRCGRPARARPTSTRSRDDAQAALERRHLEAAEQIVTALGTMKGAAMKLGQVLSFLDVGLVPEEHREEFQAKLAALRDAAPKVAFKDMRKVIEEELDDELGELFAIVRRGADRGGLDRPGLPRDAARRARRRREGPVPGRRRGGARGHAEPRADHAARQADDAGARREGDRPRRSACGSTRSSTTSWRRRTSARSRASSAGTRSSSCRTSSRACRASA